MATLSLLEKAAMESPRGEEGDLLCGSLDERNHEPSSDGGLRVG